LNHGYAAGWSFIKSHFGRWLVNLGRKLSNFSDGVTPGYSSWNIPLGPFGQRRSVDLMTAGSGPALLWKFFILGLFGVGVIMALRQRSGGLWLILITSKVLITLAFYGYARQAASIFPAFAVFMALSIDWGVQWACSRWAIAARPGWLLACVLPGGLFVADAVSLASPPSMAVDGPIVVSPQWGQTAFECSSPIIIKAAPGVR
jgi:hypothetical protein